MKPMYIEIRRIKEGDILKCLTNEEPPFDKVKVGDKVTVLEFSEEDYACYVEVEFEGYKEWVNLGDLYLNFEQIC